MARLTITLPDELHQALKEAAARRRRSIGDLVAESLEFYGIKTEERARELVARARQQSGLTEAEAQELALAETRASRQQ
ncbi:MAG: ribbon-helix-helix protein, CopG family [Thermoanaerobaculia bacterium]